SDGESGEVRSRGTPALCMGRAGRLPGRLPEHARRIRRSRWQPLHRRSGERTRSEVSAQARCQTGTVGRQTAGCSALKNCTKAGMSHASPVPAPPERRRIKEMEAVVVEVVRETPDTTTLVLFTGNERLDYEAGHFLTVDPHQFEGL